MQGVFRLILAGMLFGGLLAVWFTWPDMPEALQDTTYVWRVVTHLGSSSLLLPILAIAATALWQSRQRAAVHIWLLAVALAVMVTLATKIVFLGWGVGIATLDFTGISGHTLLATSVLPVLFGWLLAHGQRRFSLTGASFGLLVGAGVGLSRVVLGAHSISEVVAAWLAGLAISAVTLNALESPSQRPWFARLSPLVLLLSFSTTSSSYLATHDWEVRIAMLLSGRDWPYTRHHLMRPARLTDAPGVRNQHQYEKTVGVRIMAIVDNST